MAMEQKTKKTTKGSTKTTTKKSVMNVTKKEPKLTDYSFNELVSLANEKYRGAQEVLRKLYYHDTIPDNVMEDLKLAAILGHAEAQFRLAEKLIDKYNDYSDGVLWCMRSANNGCADAQNKMGDIFSRGRYGVKRNLEQAFNYYRKAAEGGNAEGYVNLAKMYRNGEYVEQNYQEALRLYTIVLTKREEEGKWSGHWLANQSLAEMYLHGLGVPENGAKAAMYYMENAHNGDNASAYNAGEIFFFGLAGVEKNLPEAIRLYEMAAEKSCPYPRALLKLAQIYEDGVGVTVNICLALKYYKMILDEEEFAYYDYKDFFESVEDYVKKKIANLEKRIAEAQSSTES